MTDNINKYKQEKAELQKTLAGLRMENLILKTQVALGRFCDFPALQKAIAKIRSKDMQFLAIGKDAGRMAEAALKACKKADLEAVCLTKYGHYRCRDKRVVHLEAGHPLPDQNSIMHSQAILDWISSMDEDTHLIVLLSGGGSALFDLPSEPYTLSDLIDLNKRLLSSGMDIAAMNKERKKYSMVKGGRALEAFSGSHLSVFALSDVESDDPRVIASGPFTPDKKDPRVSFEVIGNNLSYRKILAEILEEGGCRVELDPSFLNSPEQLFKKLGTALQNPGKHYIWGGEIPVEIKGTGKGGRCSHLALQMAGILQDFPGAYFLALATDGNDNLPGSAGAWVDSSVTEELAAKGINARHSLEQGDSFSALHAIGKTIPSGNFAANVNDVFILFWE